MKESGRWGDIEFEGTLDPEIAERWWEKVEDVMNLRSVKRGYKPREITWAEFQKEFDDKYRPKMYRDKKRMEFLNLVQGDDQTVAEYELRFAALVKYAPEAIAMQEDHCYRFEQGLRLRPEIRRGLAEGELDRVMVEDQFFLRAILLVEDNIKGHVGDGMIYRRLAISVEVEDTLPGIVPVRLWVWNNSWQCVLYLHRDSKSSVCHPVSNMALDVVLHK
ncbi:UNVERIFIED_CONTAM: hypothetical protein Sindi_0054500 [Sesamum indicum]